MINGSESIIFILINSVTLGKKSPWFVFELVILMKHSFSNSLGKRLVKKLINKNLNSMDLVKLFLQRLQHAYLIC